MSLSAYRQEIDDIDEQLLKLLNKRANVALKIAREKFDNRIGVVASGREQQIYDKLNSLNQGPLRKQHIQEIFSAIIATSKNLQHLYQSYEDI
jgi:chorismate mutase